MIQLPTGILYLYAQVRMIHTARDVSHLCLVGNSHLTHIQLFAFRRTCFEQNDGVETNDCLPQTVPGIEPFGDLYSDVVQSFPGL